MTTLTDFLLARIAEDEEVAQAAGVARWEVSYGGKVELHQDDWPEDADVFDWTVVFDEGSPSEGQAHHIARHNPARVLADCEAKRRIVELHSDKVEGSNFDAAEDCRHAACPTLRALASVYADHPDYREEWRP